MREFGMRLTESYDCPGCVRLVKPIIVSRNFVNALPTETVLMCPMCRTQWKITENEDMWLRDSKNP